MMQNGGAKFSDAIDLWGRSVGAANFALDNWWLWPVLGALTWAVFKFRSQHALIGTLDERADAAFADIDALLLERNGLLGNLAEVVRSFAEREHQVIRDILEARIESLEVLGANFMRNEMQIANVLQNLVSVSEKYPELASADHYASMRSDLLRIEDRITAARRFYNLAVEELNSVKRSFPANIYVAQSNMATREKFSLGERRQEFAEPARIAL